MEADGLKLAAKATAARLTMTEPGRWEIRSLLVHFCAIASPYTVKYSIAVKISLEDNSLNARMLSCPYKRQCPFSQVITHVHLHDTIITNV